MCITAWTLYLGNNRAMHMTYYLDLCFILSLLSLQGICLTVSFPYLISLYFVIGSSSTAAFYRLWEKSMALNETINKVADNCRFFVYVQFTAEGTYVLLSSIEYCGRVARTLHIQGVSGSNYDS
jgi:hypothetical protein